MPRFTTRHLKKNLFNSENMSKYFILSWRELWFVQDGRGMLSGSYAQHPAVLPTCPTCHHTIVALCDTFRLSSCAHASSIYDNFAYLITLWKVRDSNPPKPRKAYTCQCCFHPRRYIFAILSQPSKYPPRLTTKQKK